MDVVTWGLSKKNENEQKPERNDRSSDEGV